MILIVTHAVSSDDHPVLQRMHYVRDLLLVRYERCMLKIYRTNSPEEQGMTQTISGAQHFSSKL